METHSGAGDDGLPTGGLLPHRIHLGQIGDFWNRYDKIADSHDRKLSKHLNDNLDVLLIFVSFSVIYLVYAVKPYELTDECCIARNSPDCFLPSIRLSFLLPCPLSLLIRLQKQTHCYAS